MFLHQTLKLNKPLVDFSIKAHKNGKLLPDTFVIDLDSLLDNAKKILEKASSYNIELYFMLKQLGRNPYIAQKLIDIGYKSAVVVDFREALVMMKSNIPIGNIGHLVQVPKHLLEEVLAYGVEYVTVFSLDIIHEINSIARELGIKQKLMIRVVGPDDNLYPGQIGGFTLEELSKVAQVIKGLPHVELDAITAFPSLLFDNDKGEIKINENVHTMMAADKKLNELGFNMNQRNMPSVTSLLGLETLRDLGATQGEPGHALTGTTPVNARYSEYEIPALIYLSEISHSYEGKSYFYGGGLYRRGHMENVLLSNENLQEIKKFNSFPNDSIDYYFDIDGHYDYGTSVVMAFRTQIFVTRSQVALVEGLKNNQPRIIGIYDSQGNLVGDD